MTKVIHSVIPILLLAACKQPSPMASQVQSHAVAVHPSLPRDKLLSPLAPIASNDSTLVNYAKWAQCLDNSGIANPQFLNDGFNMSWAKFQASWDVLLLKSKDTSEAFNDWLQQTFNDVRSTLDDTAGLSENSEHRLSNTQWEKNRLCRLAGALAAAELFEAELQTRLPFACENTFAKRMGAFSFAAYCNKLSIVTSLPLPSPSKKPQRCGNEFNVTCQQGFQERQKKSADQCGLYAQDNYSEALKSSQNTACQ